MGAQMENVPQNNLIKYLLTEDRDKVSVAKIEEILKNKQVDINAIIWNNSALLVALNRFLSKEVIKCLVSNGASGNWRTQEGRLVFEIMMDDLKEAEQLKETIKCFQRMRKSLSTLSAESQQFISSKEFKKIRAAQTRSSIILKDILLQNNGSSVFEPQAVATKQEKPQEAAQKPEEAKEPEQPQVTPQVEPIEPISKPQEGSQSQRDPVTEPVQDKAEDNEKGGFGMWLGVGLVVVGAAAIGAYSYIKSKNK